LAQAEVTQVSRSGLEREKVWLSEALALLLAARACVSDLLERARELPELGEVREDYSVELQGRWVDCLEKVHAGITFHAGSRAPILEALFPHQKFPALRKSSAEGVLAYAAEFDRRSRLGYAKRIFGQADYAFLLPTVLEVPAAVRRWEACFEPSSMTEEQAAPIRAELVETASRVDRVMRQARLLAEAALLPVEGAFEESGVGARPRRRVGSVMTEAIVPVEGEIVDDGVSLAEALGVSALGVGTEGEVEVHGPLTPPLSQGERGENGALDSRGGVATQGEVVAAGLPGAAEAEPEAAPELDVEHRRPRKKRSARAASDV
ncbi:MAG: hypothetical protein L0Y64_09280, partial [Myxococcaceae bacterium]|nr:hypothetical protein [Myxococcaceae bacterium]